MNSKSALVTLSLFAATGMMLPAHAADKDEAEQVAKAWFSSLLQGETAVTTSLSDVPFAFDGKQQVKSHAELKKLYDTIVENKGKRDARVTSTTSETTSEHEIIVKLTVADDDETIAITIKKDKACRVIGFRD